MKLKLLDIVFEFEKKTGHKPKWFNEGFTVSPNFETLRRLFERDIMDWKDNNQKIAVQTTKSLVELTNMSNFILPAEEKFWRKRNGQPSDNLATMFEMQEKLNKRIGIDLLEMKDEAERTEWTLNFIRAMQQEQAELTDSLPWKWWKKGVKFDLQNARVECVDLFHFLMCIAMTLGMTADDVFRMYCEKNKVNFERQEKGYTPETKDENDCKHIQ